MTSTLWKPSSSVVMVPLLKKGLEIIPQSIFILDRFHLAQRIQGACPEPHRRGELWKAIEEGSWEEVEALLLKALSRGKNSRDQRGLENLYIYLSGNSRGNPECQAL